MRLTIDVAPKNSLVLIMDRSVGVVPNEMGGALVSATSTCVAVGTLSEYDGETSICLSDEGPPAGPGYPQVFDGILGTPSMTVSVCSILDEVLLEIAVPTTRTRIQILANDASEPDKLVIMASAVPAQESPRE